MTSPAATFGRGCGRTAGRAPGGGRGRCLRGSGLCAVSAGRARLRVVVVRLGAHAWVDAGTPSSARTKRLRTPPLQGAVRVTIGQTLFTVKRALSGPTSGLW